MNFTFVFSKLVKYGSNRQIIYQIAKFFGPKREIILEAIILLFIIAIIEKLVGRVRRVYICV